MPGPFVLLDAAQLASHLLFPALLLVIFRRAGLRGGWQLLCALPLIRLGPWLEPVIGVSDNALRMPPFDVWYFAALYVLPLLPLAVLALARWRL